MKKKVKQPLISRVLPFIFTILEKLNPRLSGKFALYLFLHPMRFKRPEREMKCYKKAKKHYITIDEKKVAVYEWGEGPVVWVMHGWAGRASQMSSFISALVKEGYKVIGFDAPGHGDSEGKESSVFHFKKTIDALKMNYGKVHAYIGHSLGGAVGFFALVDGFEVEKYVSISAPSISQQILHEAFDKIGANQATLDAMCKIIKERTGKPFDEITASHWARSAPDIPYFIIHDKEDKEASFIHAEKLHSILPDARTLFTSGLGHVRILRDPEVIDELIQFIKE